MLLCSLSGVVPLATAAGVGVGALVGGWGGGERGSGGRTLRTQVSADL